MLRKPIIIPRLNTDFVSEYGYIYIVTNHVNHKQYLGKHSHRTFDCKYYGSGKGILNAIKKYGLENFSVEVIDLSSNPLELNEKEKYWIEITQANHSSSWYNILGGGQGWTSEDVSGQRNPMYGVHRVGWSHSESTKETQSKSGYEYWGSLSREDKDARQKRVNRIRYDSLTKEKKDLQNKQLKEARNSELFVANTIKANGKKVRVIGNGLDLIFDTMKQVCSEFNISIEKLRKLCKEPVEFNGFTFSYYKD